MDNRCASLAVHGRKQGSRSLGRRPPCGNSRWNKRRIYRKPSGEPIRCRGTGRVCSTSAAFVVVMHWLPLRNSGTSLVRMQPCEGSDYVSGIAPAHQRLLCVDGGHLAAENCVVAIRATIRSRLRLHSRRHDSRCGDHRARLARTRATNGPSSGTKMNTWSTQQALSFSPPTRAQGLTRSEL